MPFTRQQQKLFHAAEHDPAVAREEHGMSSREAGKLADEADKLARQGKEKKASFIDLAPVFGR